MSEQVSRSVETESLARYSVDQEDAGLSTAMVALDGVLRRGLVERTDEVYSAQSHLDLAALALAVGADESARLLSELAFLRLGFSPAALAQQSAIAGGSGPGDTATSSRRMPGGPPARVSTIEIAVGELRGLMKLGLPARDADPATAGAERPATASQAAGDCAALCGLLRSPDHPDDLAALTDLLARLKGAYADYPAVDRSPWAGGPLPRLVDAFARDSLRRFVQTHLCLAAPPLGSPELFRAAARLDPNGLGPFFTNVPRLIRGHNDLFGLVHAAAGGAAADDLIAHWVVLLSTHVDPSTLHRTVDVLGDLRLTDALWDILTIAVRDPARGRDHPLMFALRDAGLDLGDLRLAADAQRIVAIDRRDVVIEWRILGEIHGTAGENALARQAFRQGLHFDPDDEAIRTRLNALESGSFAPFAVRSGFGDHSRARRHGALERRPDAPHPLAEPGLQSDEAVPQ